MAGLSNNAFRVLVTGSSGMVGRALVNALSYPSAMNRFHPEIYTLVRREPENKNEIYWDPYEMRIDLQKCEGFDAVVHLAGENVSSGEGLLSFTGRWTERKKHLISESRRRGTSLLAQALGALHNKPKVFVSASGVGYYGNAGSTILTEDSPKGIGFLSDVAKIWEDSCAPAAANGIRVVNLRFGAILSEKEGALGKLILPFKLGVGGVFGDPDSYFPWVTLPDAVRAISHVIFQESLVGPVNVCAPNPCTATEFYHALAKELHRPCAMSYPPQLIESMFGEMGKETLLTSQKVIPKKLLESGFKFIDEDIHRAMRAVIS